jgi:rhamnosyltransferase subunit B
MAKIVLAPYGSLGDLHPFLAIALELRDRGHEITIVSLESYREKVGALGFEFRRLRPTYDPEDRELARLVMDTKRGTETLIKDYLFPGLKDSFDDLMEATEGADLLIPGEVVHAAHAVVEKRRMKWISSSLAPISMLSTYEPNIYPNALFLRHFNFIGRPFHRLLFVAMRRAISGWLGQYRDFRREVGLSEDHDPLVDGKYSDHLHLALFSKVIGVPQPDWHRPTIQTGFCFYDGAKDIGTMPDRLGEFLDAGDPPIVFTLGSAAVMDARDFFEQSLKAAKELGRRAIALYGIFNDPPGGTDADRVAFDYAPFGELFPRAACVVHQGGVGTTSQVLRAGVPHLIVPFSHDQPDNAARCERLGVARTVSRDSYDWQSAAAELAPLLEDRSYGAKAADASRIIAAEDGIRVACDSIERTLEG